MWWVKKLWQKDCLNQMFPEKFWNLHFFSSLELFSPKSDFLSLQWEPVQYFNNKIICDLVEEKFKGIISILVSWKHFWMKNFRQCSGKQRGKLGKKISLCWKCLVGRAIIHRIVTPLKVIASPPGALGKAAPNPGSLEGGKCSSQLKNSSFIELKVVYL